MADQGQVRRLKRSVAEWNTWRKGHPEIRPSLIGATLSRTDLRGANLSSAILSEAFLSGTNLSEADLSDANLSGAILRNANFSHADLNHADLRSADLSGANLSGADLFGVNLSGASLSGVDLSSAFLGNANLINVNLGGVTFNRTVLSRTLFAWVDLSKVKGLETARYNGRSIVDINTVTLPADSPTRLHFLRGVGFTETQISSLPSLLAPRPILHHSLFISYAIQDQAIAQQLSTDLRENDVPCWFVPHDLSSDNYFRERIGQAIHSQDKLLLLLSEHSIQSGWVRYEVELALSRENQEMLFPICLDNALSRSTASWAVSLKATCHIGDFTGWQDDATYQEAFTTLLRHLTVKPFATKSP